MSIFARSSQLFRLKVMKQELEIRMEELIREAFDREAERIEAEMPETGPFDPICEGFDNPDATLVAKRFWLDAQPAPRGLEHYEALRDIRMHAGKPGSGGEEVSVSVLLCYDTKQKLLRLLREYDPELISECLYETRNLSYHLIDLR